MRRCETYKVVTDVKRRKVFRARNTFECDQTCGGKNKYSLEVAKFGEFSRVDSFAYTKADIQLTVSAHFLEVNSTGGPLKDS